MARMPSQMLNAAMAIFTPAQIPMTSTTRHRLIWRTVARIGTVKQMKDLKGALFWIAVIILAGLMLLSVGCSIEAAYRPTIKFGALREVDRRFGDSGWVGYAGISQPLHYFGEPPKCLAPPSVSLDYLHGSDLLRQDDMMTVDGLGPVFTVPLGRRK